MPSVLGRRSRIPTTDTRRSVSWVMISSPGSLADLLASTKSLGRFACDGASRELLIVKPLGAPFRRDGDGRGEQARLWPEPNGPTVGAGCDKEQGRNLAAALAPRMACSDSRVSLSQTCGPRRGVVVIAANAHLTITAEASNHHREEFGEKRREGNARSPVGR